MNLTHASECSYVCPFGTSSPMGSYSITNCSECPSATAFDSSDHACHVCPPGTFNNGSYGLNCSDCPVGTFSGPGSVNCTPCAAGYYVNYISASVCLPCDYGYSTNGTGATACVECQDGMISVNDTILSIINFKILNYSFRIFHFQIGKCQLYSMWCGTSQSGSILWHMYRWNL